jgi:multidrug efflux pump subunit AcrA (membrane-fusion protein)
MNKRAVRRAVLLLPSIIIGLLLSACRSAPKEDVVAPVVTVDVAPVLNAQIQRVIRTQALIYPLQQAAIASKISAPIKKIYVEKGTAVRAGQLLVELENQDIVGALKESQAAKALAEATFETTARATVPEETQKAELDVQAAKAALDAQQAIFDSRQSLYKEGAIAQKDVNDAQVTLTQARNQYEIARNHLANLQRFAKDESLKAAGAQRDQAAARLGTSEAQLSYSRITSPINGVVTDRPLYAGETAQPGTPLVTVMDVSQVIARAHVAQAEAAELKVGNDANIIGPDGAPIAGKVTLVSPALDAASTTVEVWVQAANTDRRLKPGASLRVELIAKTVPNALVIPQAAILTSPSGNTSVIVIDPENRPHRVSVMTAIRDAGSVQITDGLANGQRVATTGAFELGKLEAAVLAKTTVQIQAPKEEPDEDDK